jgi:hypothetical protein
VNSNKIKIVGAGSLGLILAGKIIEHFQEIEIFESSGLLGGVTRDFHNSTGSKFFLGCQYLDGSYLPNWAMTSRYLQSFEHRYASLTEQNDTWNLKLDFAGPAFVMDEIPKISTMNKSHSLDGRLSMYPKEVSSILRNHIQKFLSVDHKLLHLSSLVSLGLTRITTMSNEQELVDLKQKNSVVDNIYGVSKRNLGIKFETSYIPKFGFSKYWTDYVAESNFESKVNIRLNFRIDKKTFQGSSLNNPDEIKVWCADPRQLIEQTTTKKLDSFSYMVHAYGLPLNSYSGPNLPYYINIYSESNPIIRLYFYELESEVKVSVDSLKKYDSPIDVINDVKKLATLARLSLKITSQDLAYEKTRRYFPISQNDYQTLRNCSHEMKRLNWLDSAMYIYDRKSRLDLLLNQIFL